MSIFGDNPFNHGKPLVPTSTYHQLEEKKLTSAEKEKREEIAQAIERDQPGMDMSKKMAIATSRAKMAAESVEALAELSKATLGRYVNKASVDAANKTAEGERKRALAGADYAHNISRGMSAKTADAHMKKDYAAAKPDTNKAVKRIHGISKAVGRLTKEDLDQMSDDEINDLIENYEQLDELSKSTLGRYVKAAHTSKSFDAADIGRMGFKGDTLSPAYKEAKRHHKNRSMGINRAVDRLTKEDLDQMSDDEINDLIENYEQLDELSKSTLASYAKKASHDARMSQGISKDFDAYGKTKRKQDTKDSAQRLSRRYKERAWKREDGVNKAIDRLAKEDVETIDELSKSTLGSYVNKASTDAAYHTRRSEHQAAQAAAHADRAKDPRLAFAAAGNKQLATHSAKKANMHDKKYMKRAVGISNAVKRLTKEDKDE